MLIRAASFPEYLHPEFSLHRVREVLVLEQLGFCNSLLYNELSAFFGLCDQAALGVSSRGSGGPIRPAFLVYKWMYLH